MTKYDYCVGDIVRITGDAFRFNGHTAVVLKGDSRCVLLKIKGSINGWYSLAWVRPVSELDELLIRTEDLNAG